MLNFVIYNKSCAIWANRQWSFLLSIQIGSLFNRVSAALALALVSVAVAGLCIALTTRPAFKGQDLEVAPRVIFHVTEFVYALATDTTDQVLHGAPRPYILGDHLIEALVHSLFEISLGIVKDGSDGDGGRPSPLVFRSLGNCFEEPIVGDFFIVVVAALIIVIIGCITC